MSMPIYYEINGREPETTVEWLQSMSKREYKNHLANENCIDLSDLDDNMSPNIQRKIFMKRIREKSDKSN